MMRTGLGRGLDVLLGQPATAVTPAAPSGVTEIPLEKIVPNPQQPRVSFPQEQLQELASSIRRYGVLQPIVVSRRGDGYELVAGHRRLLASRLAERTAIPAVIRDEVGDRLELALAENLQRSDLNAIEEARAYKLLMETYSLTQEQVAVRVGKGRSTVTNAIAILDAPQILQDAFVGGKISEAHVKALRSLGASILPGALATVLRRDLSAHATEELVRRLTSGKHNGRAQRGSADPELKARAAELRAATGTKVEIEKRRRGGRITIEFYSNDEFERLYELLTRGAR
jgi:ParB family chromosome partitioning protein